MTLLDFLLQQFSNALYIFLTCSVYCIPVFLCPCSMYWCFAYKMSSILRHGQIFFLFSDWFDVLASMPDY